LVSGVAAAGMVVTLAYSLNTARQSGALPAAYADGLEGPGAKRAGREASANAVTFTKDVAPILFNNCSSCHRPGEVAPFSLITYQDAKKRAKQLAMVTESKFMPPWKADPAYGEYHDARVLTKEQIATLKEWADAGAIEGNKSDMPPKPKFTDGWTLGEPDMMLEPKESYTLGAEGSDEYRCFVIPSNTTEDRYVSAVEVRPGNRTVVHHVLVFLDTAGRARKLDEQDPAPGYTTFGGIGFTPSGGMGGWAPGNLPRHLPEGIGTLLPKGADVVLQVHYHRSGKAEKDRTKIGVYFSKSKVDKRMRILPLVALKLRIPAGEENYITRSTMPVFNDMTVYQVTPHMHLLGREMTVTANLPDGKSQPLVHIPDWDFNWQTTYALKNPLQLPKGANFSLTARYDNSTKNPRNPSNPPKAVTWGEATTDEMCIAFVGYTVDSEHLTKGIVADDLFDFGSGGGLGGGRRALAGLVSGGGGGAAMQKIIKLFDRNNNGKLDPPELAEAIKVYQGVQGEDNVKP
jgi:mono/diheme cytochrome c family protein